MLRSNPESAARARFPWWIIAGAAALALAYLPTLAAPFDFVDDGDLVYPAPAGTSLREHADLYWHCVTANVEHLGPFRPTLWLHWHVQANLFDGDPAAWRGFRFVWCALAAGMLLWLFRELRVPPAAALLAGAAAMWNPYRNEVWTSLTLSEGVAMPYALFALVAARRASRANRPLWWDAAGIACVLVALGCKNTFAAIVPAQILLRVWGEGWRAHRVRALVMLLPLALPVGHFVYFKLHWHPGQYDATGPSVAQFVRYLVCLKGAVGLDFLGAGIVLAAGAVWWAVRKDPTPQPPPPRGEGEQGTASAQSDSDTPSLNSPSPRGGGGWGVGSAPALPCAILLLAAGTVVYLPVTIISGRYAMPAVWGLDILFALLLAALLKLPASAARFSACAAVCAGLVVVLLVNVNRQERAASRARMLWTVARHIEETAPPGATVAWISGDPLHGGLGAEEGIHMQWHLAGRGRADIRIALRDANDQPLARAELPPVADEPVLRVAGDRGFAGAWEPDRSFETVYQFGRKRYDCHISRRLHFASAADRTDPGRPLRAVAPAPAPKPLDRLMAITHSHKLVLPSDANHHGTLYAGAMLRLVLEAGYATAWKHVGPQANLVLRRVLNMECLRPVPVGVVMEIQGAVLRRTAAYLICGLVGMPWDDDDGPWAEALFGFAQVKPDGKLTHFPNNLPAVSVPHGETWSRLERRMNKLLRVR